MENRSLHCALVRPTTQDSVKANSPMDSNAKMMKKKHKIKKGVMKSDDGLAKGYMSKDGMKKDGMSK
jgi:hypothetical protein